MRLESVLSVLFTSAPAWLVWFGAVIFAVIRWRQHPRVSMLVAAAAALSFVASIVFGTSYVLLPQMLSASGMSAREYGFVFMLVGLARAVVEAGAFAMLVFAAYAGRTEYESPS